MKIDNILITNDNVILSEKNITNASVIPEVHWQRLIPFRVGDDTECNKIEVDLTINYEDEDEILLKISDIVNRSKECCIQFEDSSLMYKCYLTDTRQTRKSSGLYILKIAWIGYCFKGQVVEKFSNILSKNIEVSGNLNTPIIVEVIPNITMIDLILEGFAEDPITIKNLTQGKKIIIDGEKGKVTCDGKNKFDDVDLWEFPYLIPGTNTIKLTRKDCEVIIKYNPRFL